MTSPRPDLVLSAQTLGPVRFDERISIASRHGYRGLSLRIVDYIQALEDGFDDAAQLSLIADAGLRVVEIGFAVGWADGDGMCDEEDTLWCMADLFKPRQLNAGSWLTPRFDVAANNLAALADRAKRFGLLVAVEFIPYSGISDLDAALRIVETANRRNAGLILDTWHFHRLGSDMEQLRKIPPELWLTVQIADALEVPWKEVADESKRARLLPGDGAADILGMLKALLSRGAHPLVAVEVLNDELRALGAGETAKQTFDATAELLREACFAVHWQQCA